MYIQVCGRPGRLALSRSTYDYWGSSCEQFTVLLANSHFAEISTERKRERKLMIETAWRTSCVVQKQKSIIVSSFFFVFGHPTQLGRNQRATHWGSTQKSEDWSKCQKFIELTVEAKHTSRKVKNTKRQSKTVRKKVETSEGSFLSFKNVEKIQRKCHRAVIDMTVTTH